jgi:hypothetical protein
MADVRLPSGKIISNVPDGVSQAQLRELAIASGQFTEEDFVAQQPAPSQADQDAELAALRSRVLAKDPGLFDYLYDIPKGIARGVVGGAELAARGITSQIADEASFLDPLYGIEEGISDAERKQRAAQMRAGIERRVAPIDEFLAADASVEGSIPSTFAEAAGSIIPGLGLGAIPVAGLPTAGAYFYAQGRGEAAQRARQSGATEDQIAQSADLGGLVGLSEIIPIQRILKRFRRGVGDDFADEAEGRIKRALKAGRDEAIQEAAATVAQNAIAKGIYDPETDLLAGTQEALGYGAGVGGLTQFLLDMFAKRVQTPGQPAPTEGVQTDELGLDDAGGAAVSTPAPVGGAGVEAITPDATGVEPRGVDVPTGAVPDAGVGEGPVGDPLALAAELETATEAQVAAQQEYDNEIDELVNLGRTEEEAALELNTDPLKTNLDAATTRVATLQQQLQQAQAQTSEVASLEQAAAEQAAQQAPETAQPVGRTKTVTETSADGVTTTRTEEIPETTGLDTPINDIVEGKVVQKSAREILAEQQRVKQEQDKRRELLSDPKKLAEYAEDKGISVEEMQALLEQNTVDNLARELELEDVVNRPEFRELQTQEKEKASKIKFKDTTEAAPEPDAVGEQLQQNLWESYSSGQGALANDEVVTTARQIAQETGQEFTETEFKDFASKYRGTQARKRTVAQDFTKRLDEQRLQDTPKDIRDSIKKAREMMQSKGRLAVVDRDIGDTARDIGSNLGPEAETAFLNEAQRIADDNLRRYQEEKAAVEAQATPEGDLPPLPDLMDTENEFSIPEQAEFRDDALVRVGQNNRYPKGPLLEPFNAFRVYASKKNRAEDVIELVAFDIVEGSTEYRKVGKTGALAPAMPKLKERDEPADAISDQEKRFFKGLGHADVARAAESFMRARMSPDAIKLLDERIEFYRDRQRRAKAAAAAQASGKPSRDQKIQARKKALAKQLEAERTDTTEADLMEVATEIGASDADVRAAEAELLDNYFDIADAELTLDEALSDLGINPELSANAVTALEGNVHPQVIAELQAGNLKSALRYLTLTSSNPDVARAARVLADKLGDTRIRMEANLRNEAGKEVAGMFNPRSNTVSINTAMDIKPHTILHEVTHALTIAGLANKSSAFTKQLNNIYNDVKGRLGTAYGTQSLEEFVAEAYSNPEFRRELAGLTPKGEQISVLQKLKNTLRNFVRRLMGRPAVTEGTQLSEIDNLIEAILNPAPPSQDAEPFYLNSQRDGVMEMLKRMTASLRRAGPLNKERRQEYVDEALDAVTQDAPDTAARALYGFGDMLFVADMAKKLGMGEIGVKMQRVIELQRGEIQKRDDETAQEVKELANWMAKSGGKVEEAFNRVIYSPEYGATIFQVDPTKPRSAYVGKFDNNGNSLEEIWDAQRADWAILQAAGGDVQFNKLREFYKKQREELMNIIQGVMDDVFPGGDPASNRLRQTLYNKLLADASDLDVYFPLERQGSYKLVYNFVPGSEPKGSPPYAVEMFTTSRARDRARAELMNNPDVDKASIDVIDGESLTAHYNRTPPNSFIKDLLSAIENNPEISNNEATKEQVLQLFIDALPQTALAKSLRRRKNVVGYASDSLLALKSRGFDTGRQISKLKATARLRQLEADAVGFATPSLAQINATKATMPNATPRQIAEALNTTVDYLNNVDQIIAREGIWKRLIRPFRGERTQAQIEADIQRYLIDPIRRTKDELVMRAEFARMGARHKSIEKAVRFANQLAFMATIGFNPSSAAVNLSQIPLFVYPYLGADYGYGKTGTAFKRAHALLGAYKNDIERYYNVDENGNYTVIDSPDMSPAKRKVLEDLAPMVEEASARGLLNRSYLLDALGLEESGRSANVIDKATTLSAVMFNHAERYNRQVTLLATYQLELDRLQKENAQREGKAKLADVTIRNRAIKQAIMLTQRTNGGSVLETGPRYAQQNIGRIALMYKAYGLRMYNSMLDSAKELAENFFPGNDPEAKRIRNKAFLQMVGIHGSALFFAGIHGIPLYGAAQLLADLFFLGDDEDDFNTLIRKQVGETWYKGLVNEMTGVDIASRVRLTGLLLQENRYNTDPSVEEFFGQYLGGPALSVAKKMIRGVQDLHEGDVQRGVENLLPSAVANAYKSAFGRYQEQGGIYTRRGDPIYSDMTGGELIAQALGFAPAEYTFKQERNLRNKRVEKAILTERTKLTRKYYVALRLGDIDKIQRARQEILDFNAKHRDPDIIIDAEDIKKSIQRHRETSQRMYDGVTINPALRRAIELSNQEYNY